MDIQPPLAERMRPQSLDQYIGQEHVLTPIKKMIAQNRPYSIIFWGGPGVGKTTLAYLIAHELKIPFRMISAIQSGVKEVREIINEAESIGKILLFIDEIHRFNKSQQDSLLKAVEVGTIVLIGATTENPSFEVNKALLSRCQVYTLHELNENHLKQIALRALNTDQWLIQKQVKISEWNALIKYSTADARRMLNIIEMCATYMDFDTVISDKIVNQIIQQHTAQYDKSGELHYDIISAFIKSIRGSDPDAALYYLARMINGGEDPKFIARRMLILSSEDIGLANSNALLIANACFDAVSKIGYPECRIILSQTAVYLATSPKSNSTYLAIDHALDICKKFPDLPIPLNLRNAPTKLMKDLKYGENYQYAHNYPGNFVKMDFLPDQIKHLRFYIPGNNSREREINHQLNLWWGDRYKPNNN